MIVPMNKYSFVVYHREYDEFLNNLARLGVVDVSVRRDDVDDNIRNKMLLNAQISDMIRILTNRKVSPQGLEVTKDGAQVINEVREIQANIDKLTHRATLLRKEIAIAQPWGEYSTDLIQKLYDEGYTIRFFVTPERRFASIESLPEVIEINRFQNNVYFVIVQGKDQSVDIDADEIKVPALAPAAMVEALKTTEQEIVLANKQLDDYAARYIPALIESKNRLLEEVEYQQVLIKTVKHADDKLFILNGYVPVDSDQDLENYLNSAGVIYYRERPVPDDNPPILLKNGWFAKLFEPIAEIFSLPNYKEMDLTPFFAPFFMMFFGFCMGDVAYGIILILAGVFLRRFVSPSLKPFLTLAIFLGIGTMIFGVVTGTMMGFNMDEYEFFKPIHKLMLDDTTVFYLALAIGLVQILYGMVIQAYARAKQFGFKYSLALIGVIIGVLGMIDLFLLKVGGSVSKYVIYAGIALMFLFSDPDINIFARLGKGVWDFYSNVTGIFGDVLSYIRLFALSASGGILGYVINSVSLPILHSVPILGPILFVIVMIIGHGANIALSGLGAFVHPMRLTFVEFYKNAGFVGGGQKYNPYSKH
ncbi:MAG: V-type ATP synthase subunit I [Chloroflexota bacterium]